MPIHVVDGRFHAVDHVLDLILLRNRAAFEIDHVVAVETGGDLLLERGVGQQVAGQLLDGELDRTACCG